MTRLTGTVKTFWYDRGYGFITADDGSGDVFVHISATPVGVDLPEGTRVTFDLKPDRRGGGKQQATAVEIEKQVEAILP